MGKNPENLPERENELNEISSADIKILRELDPDDPLPKLPKEAGVQRGWTDKKHLGKALRKGFVPDLTVPEILRDDDRIPIKRPIELREAADQKHEAKVDANMARIFKPTAPLEIMPGSGLSQETMTIPSIDVAKQYRQKFAQQNTEKKKLYFDMGGKGR